MEESAYKGNKALKKAYADHSFTEEQVQEFIRCSKDITYFASHYVKVVHPDRGLIDIELYDYQKDLLNHFIENRNCIVLSSRQSGKCLGGDTRLQVKDTEDSFPYHLSFQELFDLKVGQLEVMSKDSVESHLL